MEYRWKPYRYWNSWNLKDIPKYTFGGDICNQQFIYSHHPQKYISYNPVQEITGNMYMGLDGQMQLQLKQILR